jgi:predicted metal-dependent phosphoesterase TrpH
MTPGEIVDLAGKIGLKAISITDHDTLDGVRIVRETGLPEDLLFLNGVEISSTPPLPFISTGSFHILGYGVRLDDPLLNNALDKVRRARDERNPKIIDLLNREGFDISLSEVELEAGGDVIGRPHMAAVLLKKGYVASVKDAFNRFLAKGKPAYVEKYKMDCEEAIAVLKGAGGIPVLAHPVSLGMDRETLPSLLDRMKAMGLMGVEAYYSDHTKEMTDFYIGLAREKNLAVSGGSDFHGTFKADIALGTGKGNLCVPFGVFEKLTEVLDEMTKTSG